MYPATKKLATIFWYSQLLNSVKVIQSPPLRKKQLKESHASRLNWVALDLGQCVAHHTRDQDFMSQVPVLVNPAKQTYSQPLNHVHRYVLSQFMPKLDNSQPHLPVSQFRFDWERKKKKNPPANHQYPYENSHLGCYISRYSHIARPNYIMLIAY